MYTYMDLQRLGEVEGEVCNAPGRHCPPAMLLAQRQRPDVGN